MKTTHTHAQTHSHTSVYKRTIFQALRNTLISKRARTRTLQCVKLGQHWRVGFNAELICIFMWVAIKMTRTRVDTYGYTRSRK